MVEEDPAADGQRISSDVTCPPFSCAFSRADEERRSPRLGTTGIVRHGKSRWPSGRVDSRQVVPQNSTLAVAVVYESRQAKQCSRESHVAVWLR